MNSRHIYVVAMILKQYRALAQLINSKFHHFQFCNPLNFCLF
jgi:hypothetical protein